MTPWWTDQMAAWVGGIGGGVLGLLGGVFGTLAGMCAPRGKCKRLVYGLAAFMGLVGVVSLAVGIVALLLHQPYCVWCPLVLVGAIETVLTPCFIPVMRVYRQAEMRRLEAEELRRS